MKLGVSRARFEEVATQHGFTVRERKQDIYYSSLDRTYRETFLEVMDGDTVREYYNLSTIENWTTEEYFERSFSEVR